MASMYCLRSVDMTARAIRYTTRFYNPRQDLRGETLHAVAAAYRRGASAPDAAWLMKENKEEK